MTGQSWTPAPKKGAIPLHPMTFGMLLGKSFAALRHNPKVLFGFAVIIQLIVVLLTAAVMGFVLFTTFTRLETVSPSSPDFEAIVAGTVAMNIVAGILVGIAAIAFSAIMQGVVAAEVGFAAVGVKASLGTLWKRMIPSFWRLAGFAALSVLYIFGLVVIFFLIVVGAIAGGAGDSGGLIALLVIVMILLVLATIPLTVWLTTKLLLVPSILVLERATFREALVRSWRLTRGRFWVAWGVTFLISLIMGLAMQVVNLPVSLLSSLLGSVIAPTGDPDVATVVGFIFALIAPQILLLVLQAIALVVQSTGGVLVYLDCRMRYEGLDQTLIAHVEKRELGWAEEHLDDPYIVDPSRAVTKAPPPKQVPDWALGAPGGYPPYGAQQYPAQPYAPQPYGAPQQYAPPQQYGAPQPYGTPQPYAAPLPNAPHAYAPQQPQQYMAPPQTPPYAPQQFSAPLPPPAPAAPQYPGPDGWAAPGSSGGEGSA